MTGSLKRIWGKVLKNVSVATGDREGEARGKFEERTGEEPKPEEEAEETVRVKASHHDYGEHTRR